MLCERCQKNVATMRYTEVVNGKAAVRNICQPCLDQIQGDPASGFEIAGAPTAKRVSAAQEQTGPPIPHRSCSSCGVSLRVVLKTGKVGCSSCYRSFGDSLDPQMRGLHVGLRHRGKLPHLDDLRERVRADLQNKRSLMRTALKMEDYEKAATLRDEIKSLESGLGTTASGQN